MVPLVTPPALSWSVWSGPLGKPVGLTRPRRQRGTATRLGGVSEWGEVISEDDESEGSTGQRMHRVTGAIG